jgi:pyridoxamine 5'-phosphate oxidase family protein
MSAFTDTQLDYLLATDRLARLATVGADGTPHVVPVGWSYDHERDAIEVTGHGVARTKKFRDVRRTGRAAIVIDDIASLTPWHVRGVEVRGSAEAVERPRPLIRIRPERVVSWGLEGDESPSAQRMPPAPG